MLQAKNESFKQVKRISEYCALNEYLVVNTSKDKMNSFLVFVSKWSGLREKNVIQMSTLEMHVSMSGIRRVLLDHTLITSSRMQSQP